MKDFRKCQHNYKKEHIKQTLDLGKAASEIKYLKKRSEKPSAARVEELCKKIRPVVVANWTELRNGFLWQDPIGWGSMLRKDFRVSIEYLLQYWAKRERKLKTLTL